MQEQLNNNPHILANTVKSLKSTELLSNKLFSTLKMATFLLVLSVLPIQSYADKAVNYGDINDEDGQYVSWDKKLPKVEKVAYQHNSTQKISLKIETKKMSRNDLSSSNMTGYGDLDQEED